jgi:hypothetical protein
MKTRIITSICCLVSVLTVSFLAAHAQVTTKYNRFDDKTFVSYYTEVSNTAYGSSGGSPMRLELVQVFDGHQDTDNIDRISHLMGVGGQFQRLDLLIDGKRYQFDDTGPVAVQGFEKDPGMMGSSFNIPHTVLQEIANATKAEGRCSLSKDDKDVEFELSTRQKQEIKQYLSLVRP